MTAAAPAPSAPAAPFAHLLSGALRPTLACVPVIVAVLWVLRHASGGLAAAMGALLTVAFFWAGLFVMTRLVGDSPFSLLAAALAVYLGQVLVLGVVIFGLSGATWLDGVSFGLAALAVALLWQVFQVLAYVRSRKPVYDEAAARAAQDGAAGGVPEDDGSEGARRAV